MARFPDPAEQLTAEHMANPQPGDRFTERYCLWVHVIGIDTFGRIFVEEAKPPCELPRDGVIRTFANAEAFSQAYAYKNIPGWPLSYVDNQGHKMVLT